jgi:hypothetical protein
VARSSAFPIRAQRRLGSGGGSGSGSGGGGGGVDSGWHVGGEIVAYTDGFYNVAAELSVRPAGAESIQVVPLCLLLHLLGGLVFESRASLASHWNGQPSGLQCRLGTLGFRAPL